MDLEGDAMKRRKLLVRSIVGAASTGVFTAAGWLMGTRTLGMAGTWTTWESITCPDGQFDCGCLDDGEFQCNFGYCAPSGQACYKSEWEIYVCCQAPATYCETRSRDYLCNSCSPC